MFSLFFNIWLLNCDLLLSREDDNVDLNLVCAYATIKFVNFAIYHTCSGKKEAENKGKLGDLIDGRNGSSQVLVLLVLSECESC